MQDQEFIIGKEDKKYCKRCHRELKSEKSKKLGYGDVCYKKSINHKSLYLFELEDIKCSTLEK